MGSISLQRKDNFKEAWISLFSIKSKIAEPLDDRSISRLIVSQKEEDPLIEHDMKGFVKTAETNMAKILHPDYFETTVISKDTEINGSIKNQTNIKIMGIVKGNITCDADIIISGTVEGNIIGDSVTIHKGNIIGNIISKTSVNISEESMIEGDIICDKFCLNGNVTGNIQVQSTTMLGSFAVIKGNLKSQYLSIQEGAIVDGVVKVEGNKESPIEDIFEIDLAEANVAECI